MPHCLYQESLARLREAVLALPIRLKARWMAFRPSLHANRRERLRHWTGAGPEKIHTQVQAAADFGFNLHARSCLFLSPSR